MQRESKSVEVDEATLRCGRFPAQKRCGCTIPCRTMMKKQLLSQILDHLYLGPVQAAYFPSHLNPAGITHIVNISASGYNKHKFITYLDIALFDTPSALIDRHFTAVNAFIDKAKAANGKTLVHCEAGISRSPTLVIAYVMFSLGLPLDDALELVRSKHHTTHPNQGFFKQLRKYEDYLRSAKSTAVVNADASRSDKASSSRSSSSSREDSDHGDDASHAPDRNSVISKDASAAPVDPSSSDTVTAGSTGSIDAATVVTT